MKLGFSFLSFGLFVLIASCSSSSNAPDVSKPAGGKADDSATEKICSAFGLPAQCDACAVADWYNDGVCDTFCKWPDPDCGSVDGGPSYCGDASIYGADAQVIACSNWEASPLLDCAMTYCGGVQSNQLAGCVSNQCPNELAAISASCFSCVASEASRGIASIESACTYTNPCNHHNDWDAGDGYVPSYPDASPYYPDASVDASSWGADGSVP